MASSAARARSASWRLRHNTTTSVGEAHQLPCAVGLPFPVKPVQVDVTEQRRDHPALGRAGDRLADRPVLHHPGAQHRAQQFEDVAVTDAFLDRLHQPVMRNRLETRGNVGLHHPPSALPGLIDEDLQGVLLRTLRAEPERARQEVGFKDRLDDDLRRRLHDAVTDARDR